MFVWSHTFSTVQLQYGALNHCYFLIKLVYLGGMCLQCKSGWHHSLTVVLNSMSSAGNFSPIFHQSFTSGRAPLLDWRICAVWFIYFSLCVSHHFFFKAQSFPLSFPENSGSNSRVGYHDIIVVPFKSSGAKSPVAASAVHHGNRAGDSRVTAMSCESQVWYWSPTFILMHFHF